MISDHQIVIDGLGNTDDAQAGIFPFGELSKHPCGSHRAVAPGVEETINARSAKFDQQFRSCGLRRVSSGSTRSRNPERRAGPGPSLRPRLTSPIQSPATRPWTPKRAPNSELFPAASAQASMIPARLAFRTAVGPPLWTTSARDSPRMCRDLDPQVTRFRNRNPLPESVPSSAPGLALESRKVARHSSPARVTVRFSSAEARRTRGSCLATGSRWGLDLA